MFKKQLVLFVLFSSLSVLGVKGQAVQHMNLPNYDNKWMHYGFLLAGNYSNYRLQHSDYFVDSSRFSSVYPTGQISFTLGFVTNFRLTQVLDLRVLPSVAFYFREVNFSPGLTDEMETQLFETSMIEFPILLKYKSQRRMNSRMYLVTGLKPAFEVGAKKNEKSDDVLRTKTFDLSIEAGIGMDFYFELFKFAPELRFSYGLLNMLNKDNNQYTNNLTAMNTYTITFLLLFE